MENQAPQANAEPASGEVKYLMTEIELKALSMLCSSYAALTCAEATNIGGDPKQLTRSFEAECDRIIADHIERKKLTKEIYVNQPVSMIETRMRMFGVDPINEVLNLYYELFFIRFLMNEMIMSDEKWKLIINDTSFVKARTFANQQIKTKFPSVINTQQQQQQPDAQQSEQKEQSEQPSSEKPVEQEAVQ